MTKHRVLGIGFSLWFSLWALMFSFDALIPSAEGGTKEKKNTLVYELRTYTTFPGKLPNLHSRFRDHTMRLFEKHGIKNIGYWTPAELENTLVYVITHESRSSADQSWAAFFKDPDWQKAYRQSIEDGKIVKKVERQYLTLTDFSPADAKKYKGKLRLFELRTYTTAPGRLPNLHQRFRDGELELFARHGMTNVMYWKPLEKENTMVYVVAHQDRQSAKKSWGSFLNDPQWKKLHAESLQTGKIVIQVEKQFLTPSDYSPLK